MGRTKKIVIEESKEVLQPEVSTPVEEVSTPVFPIYEGARVIEVFSEREIGGKVFRHCKLSNGCTANVPIEYFK
ncbi:hypothetical protein M0R04_10200 [Candidatus Dojkabacteria bacterium]|jgi:hypothetical protein|nr:hypothetical protein [Candidatus Dojkabacteria bacterium]